MAFGAPRTAFCFCFLLTFLLVICSQCSATSPNTIFFPDDEEASSMVGRSLKVHLEDYGEPTANRGHEPPRNRAGGRNVGGKG